MFLKLICALLKKKLKMAAKTLIINVKEIQPEPFLNKVIRQTTNKDTAVKTADNQKLKLKT